MYDCFKALSTFQHYTYTTDIHAAAANDYNLTLKLPFAVPQELRTLLKNIFVLFYLLFIS